MNKLVTVLATVLVMAEVVLILASWLLSMMMTNGVRSLLSGEGIRWFLGHCVDVLQQPLLIWILLLAMSFGALQKCKLFSKGVRYRERLALRVAIIACLVYVGIVVALTFIPHAILLSATGQLTYSPFSRAFIPLLAVGMLLVALAYGFTARTFSSLSAACDAVLYGLARSAPLLLIYVLGMQLYQSYLYVFG